MSPKSRGRKNTKNTKRRKNGKRPDKSPKGSLRPPASRPPAVDPQPLVLDARTGDLLRANLSDLVRIAGENVAFQEAAEHALEASAGLLNATGPRQLEQATAELLAAELASPMMRGMRTDLLSHDLVEAAGNRVLSDIASSSNAWRGPWRLLHGLASIGPHGAGGYAAEAIADAQVPGEEPDWLGLLSGIAVTGGVHELRDKWGLRLGVLAEFGYPGVDPHVYLLDVDATWDIEVRYAAVFDDVAAAEAAWRGSLPSGEIAGELEPVTPGTLACLYEMSHLEELMSADVLLTEHYRAVRRIDDILAKTGSPRATSAFEPDPEEFSAWYRARHGHEPEDDLAEPLAQEWIEGAPAGTAQLVSPGRAVAFHDRFLEWIEADQQDVNKVMPEWIRWVGEKAGAAPEAVDESVTALELAPTEPMAGADGEETR
jgi:hypothetical protein